MKKLWLLSVTLCATFTTNAQITDQQAARQAAFTAAKAMDEALILRQYDKYVSFNHPEVLKNVEGGRDGMVAMVSKQMLEIQESGNMITAVWPKMPDVVIDTAGEWQATLQQYMTYRLPEGKIKSVTTIIGMSPDKGTKWYFVDAAGRDLKQLRELFPTLSSKLKIPKPTEPEFTPDDPNLQLAPATGK